MVKINKIYTRTGDDGTTGLVGGDRVGKDALRVEAFGTVDELNATIGVALSLTDSKSEAMAEALLKLENELFDLGALLAAPPDSDTSSFPQIGDEAVLRLENLIDTFNDGLPELRSFVLPGPTQLNSALHLCRAVARRAERRVIALSRVEKVEGSHIRFLNRISDLFFAMARRAAHTAGVPEVLWKPGG